jgi:hypothetical protein
LANLAAGDTLLALDSVDFTSQGQYPGQFGISVTIDGGTHGAFVTSGQFTSAGGILFQGNGSVVVLRNVTMIGYPAFVTLQLAMIGGSATLENVTVIGAGQSAPPAIYITPQNGSVIHMKNVTVLSGGTGLQIVNQGGAAFTLEAENLSVDVAGTGAQLTDGNGVIRNSQFRNTAGTSTGLALLSSSTTPTWLLDTCRFQGLSYGLVTSSGTVKISNSEFTGNTFGIFGSGTTISFRNNVFAGNGTDGSPILSTSLK